MKVKRILPILLVLLLAFLLRVYALNEIPPGLTHDEANHGREAIGILGGEFALFFPLNYGSEPLYSYTAALVMGLGGRNILALRLVNVYFGLLTVAAAYLWSRHLFTRRVALLAAALLAISFWPVAASRQALRAGMMPLFTVGAMTFFWLLLVRLRDKPVQETKLRHAVTDRCLLAYTLGFTLCLIATLYNYLAARVFWLVFPLFLAYLALAHRSLFRRSWQLVTGSLLLFGLSVIPMQWYLSRFPEAQTRLDMLDTVVQQTLRGDLLPLAENISRALLAFVWPGQGDQFLAYNIPGRPVFVLFTALFFLIGVAVCLWRWRRAPYFLLLLWFLVGIIPSLITGPTANTTRNVGAYVPAFVLPAVGFMVLAKQLRPRLGRTAQWATGIVVSLWLIVVLSGTVNDYFVRWGQAADVRAAYQHTLVSALTDLPPLPAPGVTVISSVYPGPAHNPSIGLVVTGTDEARRWVDAQFALVLPASEPVRLVAMAATPVHPAFSGWVHLQAHETLRSDDLNPGYSVYQLALPSDWTLATEPVTFGQDQPALQLVDHRWLTSPVMPGDTAELLQIWRVLDPAGVGPITPPSNTTDVVLFSHVLHADGSILAQQDRLDAPSWDWQRGDLVVQIHQLTIPPETTPGAYQVVAGVYDRATGVRLPVWDSSANGAESRAFLLPLEVIAP